MSEKAVKADKKVQVNICDTVAEIYIYEYNSVSDFDVVIIPGWGEGIKLVEPLAYNLSKILKTNVYVIDYEKLDNPVLNNIHIPHKNNHKFSKRLAKECPDAFCKAKLLEVIIDKFLQNNKKVVFMAHSEGAIPMAIFHKIYTENNGNSKDVSYVLVAPAAVIHSNFFTLSRYFLKYFIYRLISSNTSEQFKYYFKSLLFIFKNPSQLLRIATCIPKMNILSYIAQIKENKNKFAIILFKEDMLFNLNKMQKKLKQFESELIFLEGGHAELHINVLHFVHEFKKILKDKLSLNV